MVPFFSATASDIGDTSSIAEIQLLADQELMSLWEQTQMAAAAITAHGGTPRAAMRYERAVLMEMLRRQASRPERALFGVEEQDRMAIDEASPHFMMVHL